MGLTPSVLPPCSLQTWPWSLAAAGSATLGRAATRMPSWLCRWPPALPTGRAAPPTPAAPPRSPSASLTGTAARARPPPPTCATPSPLACWCTTSWRSWRARRASRARTQRMQRMPGAAPPPLRAARSPAAATPPARLQRCLSAALRRRPPPCHPPVSISPCLAQQLSCALSSPAGGRRFAAHLAVQAGCHLAQQAVLAWQI